jgi:polysaccharide export outer membrane protein
MTYARNVLLWVSVLAIFASCTSSKKSVYFLNQPTAEIVTSNEGPKPVIDVNDLLSISVSSLSAQASGTFNAVNTGGIVTNNYSVPSTPVSGYLVGTDGYIKFPQLGKIKAKDLTTAELEEYITNKLLELKLLQEPIVTVRHLNFKVTVLGEVARPSVFNVPNAKISLLEAIGMAGDLTIYGKRNNVLLIREENNKKLTVRINLNSSDLLQSPYYYLKSNDIIYVEPNSAKVTSASKTKEILPMIFSAVSLAIIGLDIIVRH